MILETSIKILCATIIGALIGYERTYLGKHAGIRTHALLCMATCGLTCLSELLLPSETPRIISGIVQGIGFIGAGVIFLQKQDVVKGLTSSVILWMTGIIGIILGTEYYLISIPILICYFVSITVLNNLEIKVKNSIKGKERR